MSSIARPRRWAILDCNSFYCSCERLFRPHLRKAPMVVLSNNDGCIISLSKEAKALGIKMGAPVHEVRPLIRRHRVQVFSSNYQLYGDISRRVMRLLDELHPDVLQYSIDEAFIDFSHIPEEDLQSWAQALAGRVWREIGVPVTVGVAATKTQAKLVSRWAKTQNLAGAYLAGGDLEDLLARSAVEDVWGIGPQTALKLRALGVRTARELRDYPNDALIRALLTVTGERLRDELRGVSCVEPAQIAEKKMIASTRSFGRRVYEHRELCEAVATYVGFAAEKLRAQNSLARGLGVMLRTGAFADGEEYYRNDAQVQLVTPTSDSGVLTREALGLVKKIFRSGIAYKKAGVFLFDLSPAREHQLDLFAAPEAPERGELMKTMDGINRRWGRGTIRLAATGVDQDWRMLCEHRSNRTQLEWGDLVEIRPETWQGNPF